MGSFKIPYSFIQELLSKVDIVDIVSHYISLKQVGRNFTALCPFHVEKTPSFVVSPEKQIFKCFGCGVGGNAITFVEKYENLSFFEAVRRVAELSGIEIPQEFGNEEETSIIEETGLKAAKFFYSKLKAIKGYLEEREIPESIAKKFLLGYAPKGYSKSLKINREAAQKLGLLNSKGREFFSERLIIPIFSHSGKVVAFAGRILNEDSKLPKYINSPESDTFKKGNLLYGFYQSKEAILKKREVFIVEGYFDVISLHKVGVENVVAPMGTSLTENHAKHIKRYSATPVLMFDGDNAGRKAALRSARIFYSLGVEPFVVELPEGEDPDSMARKNEDLLKEHLNSPQDFVSWSLKKLETLNDVEKTPFLKEIVSAIFPLKFHDPFKFKSIISKLEAEFDVDEKWIRKNVVDFRQKERSLESQEELIPPYEKAFLKALLEEQFPLPIDVSPTNFVSQKVATIYTLFKNMKDKDLTSFQVQYPELSNVIADVLLSEFSEVEIKSAVCKVLSKEIDRRLKKTKELKEKMFLKKLVFDLKRGNLEKLRGFALKTG
ncbi:MAG: DNA primase [Desulfurobacteriaceae bacterium]